MRKCLKNVKTRAKTIEFSAPQSATVQKRLKILKRGTRGDNFEGGTPPQRGRGAAAAAAATAATAANE